jgi:hypothetical protein
MDRDWSSDVCSSDLKVRNALFPRHIPILIKHQAWNGREAALEPNRGRGDLACHLALSVVDLSLEAQSE